MSPDPAEASTGRWVEALVQKMRSACLYQANHTRSPTFPIVIIFRKLLVSWLAWLRVSTSPMPDFHSLEAGVWPENAIRNNGPDHLVIERMKLRELAEGWPCYRYG